MLLTLFKFDAKLYRKQDYEILTNFLLLTHSDNFFVNRNYLDDFFFIGNEMQILEYL